MVDPTSFGLQFAHLLDAVRYRRELLSRLYDEAHDLQKRVDGFSERLRSGDPALLGVPFQSLGRVMQTPIAAAVDVQMKDGAIRNIFAGTVVDVLDAVLDEPLRVFRAKGGDAKQLTPIFGRRPFWRVLRATRNMHHHHRAWGRAKTALDGQQKREIEVITAVLGLTWNPGSDPCPFGSADLTLDVLDCVSRSYEDLDSHVHETAGGMVTLLGLDDDAHVVFARAKDASP